jgi:hypothetical protein
MHHEYVDCPLGTGTEAEGGGRGGEGEGGGGGLRFNRAPALPRHSVCVFRVPRPKPRLPEEVGTPLRKAARVVRGGARPPRGEGGGRPVLYAPWLPGLDLQGASPAFGTGAPALAAGPTHLPELRSGSFRCRQPAEI